MINNIKIALVTFVWYAFVIALGLLYAVLALP